MEGPVRPRLTELSHGSGCGCKIAPLELEEILKDLHNADLPGILVDHEQRDDAAVVQLNDEQVLVSTTDFFTPIVDDPFDFGRIAATNALSDIYAMGAQPIMALSILGWPIDLLGTDSARQVMAGAKAICHAHDVGIIGGHSIEAKEPFFGLSVNGLTHPHNIKRNQGAKPGDALLLTKALGTGMMSSAFKRGSLDATAFAEAVDVMTTVNTLGATLGKDEAVHAMTDISGFGMLGHLLELCSDELGAHIAFEQLPLINAKLLKELSAQMIVPNNTMRNFKAYHEHCSKMSVFQFHVLCDPQTSGGLLLAVDPEEVDRLTSEIEQQGGQIAEIGRIQENTEGPRILLV